MAILSISLRVVKKLRLSRAMAIFCEVKKTTDLFSGAAVATSSFIRCAR